MSNYQLTWITENLAIGSAPMSFADLGVIRDQDIDGIVNLCGEYCDLHEIESQSDFEVYYLPIPDESVPDMAAMEMALDWLDESIYLGKKILVHCRFGIGRTGTFVTAYLIRKGLSLKVAEKKLKTTPASPESFRQWRLLKKYSKKTKQLKAREPSLENRQEVDLGTYFDEYESLVAQIEDHIDPGNDPNLQLKRCGSHTEECCFRYFDLGLMETVYLHNRINRLLKSQVRSEVIRQALDITVQVKKIRKEMVFNGIWSSEANDTLQREYGRLQLRCPLSSQRVCLIYDSRPISCRTANVSVDKDMLKDIDEALVTLSRNIFLAFTGNFMKRGDLIFSMADTISGRFVEQYFNYLAGLQSVSEE